jgi:CheY-like chemotaxis protein/anti-sigma regulatory factor (Ser/Thr protein kinase)
VRDLADARGQAIVTDVDPSVATVFADARRLKQVLVNILTNAVKFGATGAPITFGVRARREAGRLELSVANTGIGIAEEERERIFEPFVTLDQGLTRQQPGAGLGLALVKRLVEAHGGSVHVESEPGVGATFVVSLPWSEGQDPDAPIARMDGAGHGEAPVRPEHARRVLLVEDNEANILTVKSYLEAKGFRVRVARDGLAAVTAARGPEIDVVLMDIQLPVMDGLEAIRRIRAAEVESGRRPRPIIALTAFTMPGDEQRCLAAGATRYLSKPVELRGMARKLDELTDRSREP